MIVLSLLGLRCQGLYRGTVILHLPHGRLKVFIYGVYPDEYFDHPEYLPICELITPLWGGSYNGNGSFSYPNIGSTVFVLFANEDVNQPIAIGATLGGENAYNLYNNIKAQDEEVSKKHMFTTGMAHFLMHESGKISSYVQLPYDNNVSIDFSHGDVTCKISADIAQKINANEISHIVCLQVLDNKLDKGEISVSTHYYEPFSFARSYYLSDTQEAVVRSIDREVSAINYCLRNNLGDIADNEICSLTNSTLYINSNIKDLTTILSTLEESDVANNIETTNIDGKKDIVLKRTYNKDVMQSNIDAKTNNMHLSTYRYEEEAANADYNHINGKRNISTSNNKATNTTSIFYDNKAKMLSAFIALEDDINGSYKNLNLSGVKDDVLQNLKTFKNIYLYANDAAKEIVLSSGNTSKLHHVNDYLDNNTQNSSLQTKRCALSTNNDELLYLTISPTKSEISTLNLTILTNVDNINNNSIISTSLSDNIKILSTHIDVMKTTLTSYNENSSDAALSVIDKNKNIKLNSQSTVNILSTIATTADVGNYSLINTNSNLLNIDLQSIALNSLSTHDYIETHTAGSIVLDNLTSDNKFSLNTDNTAELKTQFIHSKNNTLISAKYFLLKGDANCKALIELSNYENYEDIRIDKNTKIEFLANEDDTSIELKANDVKSGKECSTKMSIELLKIDTYIKDNTTENTMHLTMDLENEQIILRADSSNECIIKFDSSTGEITISSQKVLIIAENEIALNSKSMVTVFASDLLNLTAGQLINVTGTVNVNGEANFYNKTRFLSIIDSNINAPSGTVNAIAVNANTINANTINANSCSCK